MSPSPRREESRRYYLKNRDKILTKVRAYRKRRGDDIRAMQRKKYAENYDHREEAKAFQRKWRREHKEEVNAYQRVYRRTVLREWHNAWKRKWAKTPLGKLRTQEKGYRRRALLGASIGRHTVEEWEEMKRRQGHRCNICRKKKRLTKDHVRPLSRGGGNTIDNIQGLCLKCNLQKSDKLPNEMTT